MVKQTLALATALAIEEVNRRFLADPEEIRKAQQEGDAIRHQLEAECILPVLVGDKGCTIHEGRDQ